MKPKKKKSSSLSLLLVGLFLLGVFLFAIYQGELQQQSIIINEQRVPLTAIPNGFTISNLQPLQIELCKWEFMMRDATTEKGIPDVHIKLVCDELGEHGEASVYTNKKGYAKITLIRVDQATVTAKHPYYETREGVFGGRHRSVYVDWNLTPKPPDGDGDGELVKVILYAQVDKKNYVIIGSVNVEDEDYEFDRPWEPTWFQPLHPAQKAVMWLQPNTLYTMYVDGWYNKVERDPFIGGYTGYNPVDFSYTIQIETGGSNQEYWIDLLTGDLHGGTPPPPTPDPWDWLIMVWQWLTSTTLGIGNWMIVVVGAVALYALPYLTTLASLARTFKGE